MHVLFSVDFLRGKNINDDIKIFMFFFLPHYVGLYEKKDIKKNINVSIFYVTFYVLFDIKRTFGICFLNVLFISKRTLGICFLNVLFLSF